MARLIPLVAVFLIPVAVFSAGLVDSASLISDLKSYQEDKMLSTSKYEQIKGSTQEETSIGFNSRVDIYEADCGKGYVIIINEGDQVSYNGFGCEGKERSFVWQRKK